MTRNLPADLNLPARRSTGSMGSPGAPPQISRRRLLAAAPAWGATFVSGGLLSACASAPRPHGAAVASAQVAPFSGPVAAGGLPEGWLPYVIRRDLARTAYRIDERDGRTVLHATAESARSGLHCPVNIEAGASPWLRWQWRVDEIAGDATVADDDAEDTPARVVVAFDGDVSRLPQRDRNFFEQVELFTGIQLPFATLTYVWDGLLPVGRVQAYPRSARIQYQVVESGGARLGQWLGYERNVVEDYVRIFGSSPPGRITSVGVMTDSDDLKNRAEAWYGDIGLYDRPGSVA